MRYYAAITGLFAWLVLSFALTVASYRAGGVKSKKMAVLIWLLIFFGPGLSYLGAALLNSAR